MFAMGRMDPERGVGESVLGSMDMQRRIVALPMFFWCIFSADMYIAWGFVCVWKHGEYGHHSLLDARRSDGTEVARCNVRVSSCLSVCLACRKLHCCTYQVVCPSRAASVSPRSICFPVQHLFPRAPSVSPCTICVPVQHLFPRAAGAGYIVNHNGRRNVNCTLCM